MTTPAALVRSIPVTLEFPGDLVQLAQDISCEEISNPRERNEDLLELNRNKEASRVWKNFKVTLAGQEHLIQVPNDQDKLTATFDVPITAFKNDDQENFFTLNLPPFMMVYQPNWLSKEPPTPNSFSPHPFELKCHHIFQSVQKHVTKTEADRGLRTRQWTQVTSATISLRACPTEEVLPDHWVVHNPKQCAWLVLDGFSYETHTQTYLETAGSLATCRGLRRRDLREFNAHFFPETLGVEPEGEKPKTE